MIKGRLRYRPKIRKKGFSVLIKGFNTACLRDVGMHAAFAEAGDDQQQKTSTNRFKDFHERARGGAVGGAVCRPQIFNCIEK